MRVDFRKKNNVLVQKQKCGISNDVFSCGNGTAEIQVTAYCTKLWSLKSQIVLCAKAGLLNFETWYIPCAEAKLRNFKSQNILCAEAEVRDFMSKLLYGSGTAKLQVVLVWKQNCLTSKPQYFPCAEAELCHFRAPSHTLFCMRKRNCGTLSLSIVLVRRRNFNPKNIQCVEAELQSHNSLCAEAELQVT